MEKSSFKRIRTNGQYDPAMVGRAPGIRNTTTGSDTALAQSQIVDEADGATVNDKILFKNILKRMWTEMSIGDNLCFSGATGIKFEIKKSIIGYDLNEAVCGTRNYLRSL